MYYVGREYECSQWDNRYKYRTGLTSYQYEHHELAFMWCYYCTVLCQALRSFKRPVNYYERHILNTLH